MLHVTAAALGSRAFLSQLLALPQLLAFPRLLALGLAVGGCASSSTAWTPPANQDRRDVPAEVRPGHGDAGNGTWFPLTAPEVAALGQLADARQGDARALLGLALVASAGPREAASYAAFQDRVDKFVAEVRPAVTAAADDWHRGYELHRAMHRVFFRGGRGELDGYELSQSRVAGIFETGRYNCLSSSLLFVVLARALDLPVRAVVVPTHVFVELGPPGGKIIEVETTSATGFDWVHDERFYRDEARNWSSTRGLRPVTLDDYQHRQIVEPARLMAVAMRNAHPGESEQDRKRMAELAAIIDDGDSEMQQARLGAYLNEAHDLYEAKAWRTMVKLFDAVATGVRDIAARSKDPKTLELVSWANWQYSHALLIVGRGDDAAALMSEGLDRLDPTWPDADKLTTNYLSELNNRICESIDKKDPARALKLYTRHKPACLSNQVCAGNVGVVYGNWAIDYQNAGDWQGARRVLQECAAELPADTRCRDALTDLESKHRF